MLETRGVLYVVATPIGHLKDLSFRAVEVLKEVDWIACEDTRHSKVLLDHYGIQKPLISYFDFSESKKAPHIVQKLKSGQNGALISDAGTPGISDPGYRLVRLCIDEGVGIEAVPGPSALITALVLSGLPTDRFVFEGFMPIKEGQRKNRLVSLKDETRTVIFYESPHRLLKTLAAIQAVYGDVPIVAARELTKKFQEICRDKVSAIRERFEKGKVLGEFVILWNLKT